MDKFETKQLMKMLNNIIEEHSINIWCDYKGAPHSYIIDKIIDIIKKRGNEVIWASFKYVCFYKEQ